MTFFNFTWHILLISVSLVLVHSDDTACNQWERTQNLRQCLTAIRGVSEHSTPYVTDRSNLQVYMDVTYTSAPQTYQLCCEYASYKGNSITINPLASTVYTNDILKYKPRVSFTTNDNNLKSSNQYYMLGLFDSNENFDGSNQRISSLKKPYLHWLKINMAGLDFNTGTGQDIVPYLGPGGTNTYMLLLFKQRNGQVSNYRTGDYSTSCGAFDGCNFDLQKLIRNYNLEVIGAVPIHSQATLAGVKTLMDLFGLNEADACKGFWNKSLKTDGRKVVCTQGVQGHAPRVASLSVWATAILAALTSLLMRT